VNGSINLYLVLDLATLARDRARGTLSAALAAAPVATVLLTSTKGAAIDAALAKDLISLGQKQGTAMLIADDAALARSLKADGVHLNWRKDQLKAYREARDVLGAHAIVGADAGRSRHDAMELGEAGADYIAFGIPPHVEDIATARERQVDLVGWWSEIFEIPCVAFDVSDADGVAVLSAEGADFIATTLPAASDDKAIADFVRAVSAAHVERVREPT
jgi:thiamine-phosphate pyrophosphorylase